MTTVQQEWQKRYGRPEPKIVCVGMNYADHAAEIGAELPERPALFGKFANTLCGHEEPIVIPKGIGHIDAEAELAVVIGRESKDVSEHDAFEYVDGYMCANDVSARDAQFSDSQWFRSKTFDTFCPVGPRLVALDDPGDLRIAQRVNGQTLQDSSTAQLVFSVPFLVSYISRVLTLAPGDLILTGTPAGIGYFREPKLSLRPGDVCEIEIEAIGVLRNEIR